MVYKLAKLSGKVMGYTSDKYTRPLKNVNVFVRIHVRDNDNNEHVYNPLNEEHIKELSEKYHDLFYAIMQHKNAFSGKTVDNDEGLFEFADVPVGWWCYVIAADAQGKEFDIRNPMGDNGKHINAPIRGPDLETELDRKDIIVPVEDEWYVVAEPKDDDPPMDPKRDFRPGFRDD